MRGPLEHVMIYAAIFSNRYGGRLVKTTGCFAFSCKNGHGVVLC